MTFTRTAESTDFILMKCMSYELVTLIKVISVPNAGCFAVVFLKKREGNSAFLVLSRAFQLERFKKMLAHVSE